LREAGIGIDRLPIKRLTLIGLITPHLLIRALAAAGFGLIKGQGIFRKNPGHEEVSQCVNVNEINASPKNL
jgi:hypothetical protein